MNLDFLADQIFSCHPRSDFFDSKDHRFEALEEALFVEDWEKSWEFWKLDK